MSQPTPYVPSTSFIPFTNIGYVPGQQLDIEFNDLATTLNEALANLALIQKDDTTLANNSVDYPQLSPALTTALAALGVTPSLSILISGIWNNARAAKTASYSVAATDVGLTFALSTSGQTLTFNAATAYPSNFITTLVNEDAVSAWLIAPSGLTSFFLYPGQTAIVFRQGNAWVVHKNDRWKFTRNVTLFVATTGNDANDGLTVGSPLLTIQKAYDLIAFNMDLAGHAATIQLADGTYTAGLLTEAPPINEGLVVLNGNAGSPANVLISISNNNAIVVTGAGVAVQVQNLKIQTSVAGDCILIGSNAVLTWTNVIFGACAGSHIECIDSAQANCIGNYSITGGGISHLHAYQFGFIQLTGQTVTITGTPAFSGFFAGTAQAQIVVLGATFSGSATGAKFLAHNLGWININGNAAGVNYFPGDSSGLADATTFGLYS